MYAIEALIASLGIVLFGFISIPYIGGIYGVQITDLQGAQMSATFFVMHFVWLYALRKLFHRYEK